MTIRNKLKQNSFFHSLYIIAKKSRRVIKPKKGLFLTINLLVKFYRDFYKYKKANNNKNMPVEISNLYPCIFDNTDSTPLDYTYFYQDSWCAKKIFENKPDHHYDFGSEAKMIGIISQFTKTTMIDIRPIDVELEGLHFRKADILRTGFPDNSISSLSSICVLEHIGLGRYGDEMDPFGTEESITEIKRILAQNGNLYISLPIDNQNRTYFNAHRAFTRDYILEVFSPLKLLEEKYIYGKRMQNSYDSAKGFGTGLFHFKK